MAKCAAPDCAQQAMSKRRLCRDHWIILPVWMRELWDRPGKLTEQKLIDQSDHFWRVL